jgi:exonuclease SbcD
LNSETCDNAIDIISNWLSYELEGIPESNDKVLIGHLAIDKAFWVDEVDDVSNELMVSTTTFEGYDYVWMGHVHKPQVMKAKYPYIAHIGSMDISDFGETDQQKVVILFDPSSKDKFEEIPIPTRPLRRIRLEIPKDEKPTSFLLKSIENMTAVSSFDKAIVKLEIKILDPESPELDREQIIKKLKGLGAYHISSFSESRTVMVVPEDKQHISDSAIKPKEAVKLYAESIEFDENEEKNEFISVCLDVIAEEDSQ